MHNLPRAVTVVCSERGTLWALDRKTFRYILVAASRNIDKNIDSFLSNVKVRANGAPPILNLSVV